MRHRWLLFFVVAVMTACAGSGSVQLIETATGPRHRADPQLEEMRAEASSWMARENYLALKRAFGLYEEIEARAGAGAPADENHLRTALLLAARAGEIGVREPAYSAAAARLIERDPAWAGYAPFLTLVRLLPLKTAGIFDDGPEPEDPQPAVQAMMKNEAALFGGSENDPVSAYLRGSLHAAFPGRESRSRILPDLLRRFPDSRALKYRLAGILPNATSLWDEVLEADPEFSEARAARGERALGEQRLLSAEKDLLGAFEQIPESPLLAIRLASISFALEEYDLSLNFYERALAVAPGYKEAALGRSVALTCLGRGAEAIPILAELVARGPALRGECRYWLAWNLHEKGDLDLAADVIEAAKPLLERSQVYTLSGTINWDRSRPAEAEADLMRAVGLDANDREAHLLLGRIYAERRIWTDSGLHFRMAAYGYEQEEKDLSAKAAQIEAAELAAERKARLLARKRAQVEKARLTRATAYYNAAAGFHNAGEYEIARDLAGRAAFHPALKAKALEFAAFLATLK